MCIQLLFVTLAATAAAQFTTSVQGSVTGSVTFARTTTARPASIATTSFAVYTPLTTVDSWVCATKNYSDYLQPPMPTGHLLDVYYDHSDTIYKECEDNLPKPLTIFPACPSVAKASWCALYCLRLLSEYHALDIYADHLILNSLSTAVPSSDLADFRSYTKSATSWWAARSSMLADLQKECPNTWENAKMDIPSGEIWLNATIALAGCSDEEISVAHAQAASVSASSPVTGDASLKTKIDVFSVGLAVAMLML